MSIITIVEIIILSVTLMFNLLVNDITYGLFKLMYKNFVHL